MIEVRGPFNSREVEQIYYELMRSNLYDENYNAHHWNPSPYERMAEIIEHALALTSKDRLCDLGSGRGFLTLALLRRGYDAYGVEFSPRMYASIPDHDRHHFKLIETIRDINVSEINVLTCLEVFEHLPMKILVEDLSWLRQGFVGDLFLTIPSSGMDRTLPKLGFAEADQRLAAMAVNEVCPYLVYDDEVVSGGHITLAGYRWWEDFFLTQGFARQTDKELKLQPFQTELKNCTWCPYILKSLAQGEVMFGRGWHESEGDFRWSALNPEISFLSEADDFQIVVELALPPPNIAPERQLRYFVEMVYVSDDYRISSDVIASGKCDLNGLGSLRQVKIPISRLPPTRSPGAFALEDGAIHPFSAYRVYFHTSLFSPAVSMGTHDERTLGFAFSNVYIEDIPKPSNVRR